jgi:hypothetical protein
MFPLVIMPHSSWIQDVGGVHFQMPDYVGLSWCSNDLYHLTYPEPSYLHFPVSNFGRYRWFCVVQSAAEQAIVQAQGVPAFASSMQNYPSFNIQPA